MSRPLQPQDADRRADQLYEMCRIAPDQDVPAAFRALAELDPERAALILENGLPGDEEVRASQRDIAPLLAPVDLTALLNSPNGQLRRIAIAAKGRLPKGLSPELEAEVRAHMGHHGDDDVVSPALLAEVLAGKLPFRPLDEDLTPEEIARLDNKPKMRM